MAKNDQDFAYIKKLLSNSIDYEVLVGIGSSPSLQRNLLANKAEGDYILFLDDDSKPAPNLLEQYLSSLHKHPDAEVLGGPSLLIEREALIYCLSKEFFSNKFGIGPIRSRYNSIGALRKANEKDLILSNLLMKKDFFLLNNGFNPVLYPGEENEFLKRVSAGSQIFYDPDAVVCREPRDTVYLFLKQMFSYGKGRSKHMGLNNKLEKLFFIPMFFSIYVLALPLTMTRSHFLLAPLLLHFFMTLAHIQKSQLSQFQKCLVPFFFFLGHFSYGFGLIFGFVKYKLLKKFTKSTQKTPDVQIYILKSFKKSST